MKSGVFETYEREGAVQFICNTTNLDRESVARVLLARDHYRLGVGVDIAHSPDDQEIAATRRAAHPALFPPDVLCSRYVSPRLERAFVVIETGLDEALVRCVLSADRDYLGRRAAER